MIIPRYTRSESIFICSFGNEQECSRTMPHRASSYCPVLNIYSKSQQRQRTTIQSENMIEGCE